ncbi:excalibur calcium-binding domain-containing protein [Alkanindiges illinoisensis]|uniref:excalibur calcium-binding domain-containing protein n=1 Tax=Alkanindiges illinoisensis TaxID=197183 RepID=UPI00055415A2|nr:excalibur calcium-binding domain-containing protein [Alkanindiges illinoisensis]
MKYLCCLLIGLSTVSFAATQTENPFGTGQHTHKKSVTKTAKSQKAKKTESCSNLPTRCADIADCADAQRALRCGMTRLDRDNDGVACDKDCQ